MKMMKYIPFVLGNARSVVASSRYAIQSFNEQLAFLSNYFCVFYKINLLKISCIYSIISKFRCLFIKRLDCFAAARNDELLNNFPASLTSHFQVRVVYTARTSRCEDAFYSSNEGCHPSARRGEATTRRGRQKQLRILKYMRYIATIINTISCISIYLYYTIYTISKLIGERLTEKS